MFVYFSETQAKKNDFRGPDFFAVLGRPQVELKSWVAWEQDGRLPDIVIELLSPTTEAVDRGIKMRIYRDVWKVRRYYLYDPYTFDLEGYALIDGAYVPITPNSRGHLECAPLGLELGLLDTDTLENTWPALRWFDEGGALLPKGEERAAQAEAHAEAAASRARAEIELEREAKEREKARADALERRLAELEGRK